MGLLCMAYTCDCTTGVAKVLNHYVIWTLSVNSGIYVASSDFENWRSGMDPEYYLSLSNNKLGESATRVINRAFEEMRRRKHSTLNPEHLFLAYAQVEWETFTDILLDFKLSPSFVLQRIEECFGTGSFIGRLPSTKMIGGLAHTHAKQNDRGVVESIDLFAVLFEENNGVPAMIIKECGIDPQILSSKIKNFAREKKNMDWDLTKRYELPSFLKHYGTNLNLLVRQNKISPIFGRGEEIRQMVEILCRRERANSVMLVGEAGVGKTAVVEALAQCIEYSPSSIPLRLRDCQIVNLQMNTMVAGTMLRGMFEDRMENVIKELKERPNLILFIDEAHNIIGAGSALGTTLNAADVLKSAMARGEVRVIAATTLSEYKRHIQEDEAFARRFRCVRVEEPTTEETRLILKKIRPRLERNYSVRIMDEAIETALEMSPRYMRHLHLPDKVIGWIDTASVRREMGSYFENSSLEVKSEDIISVISQTAGIPKDMVFRDVTDRFKDIEDQIQKRVLGQKNAIAAVARRLILNKGPLKENFYRPDGVLLFLGPTGVGKTELAKAVAEFLFGDEKKMIRIDMSEFQNNSSVAVDKLIGSPSGVAGSERGGILTNQLRDNPYSVILLDEIEKAGVSVFNLFLQAFDEGWLTDGRGKKAYLSDSIVIMTSNIGSENFRKLTNPLGFLAQGLNIKQVQGDVKREFERRFSPEFRNRIDEVVLFSPLSADEVRQIAVNYLEATKQTLTKHEKRLHFNQDAIELIVQRGYSVAYGARFLKRAIDDIVKVPISQRWKEANDFYLKVENQEIVVNITGNGTEVQSGGMAAV